MPLRDRRTAPNGPLEQLIGMYRPPKLVYANARCLVPNVAIKGFALLA
jgi:hypothetical protein